MNNRWGKAEALFCSFLFCEAALIVNGFGVVEWGRTSYLGPAEIKSFCFRLLKSQSVRGASCLYGSVC